MEYQMKLAATIDFQILSAMDATTKPWCIKNGESEKVDICELLKECKPDFTVRSTTEIDVSKVNWFNKLGYLIYFTSLWQRLSVRNNGCDISKWLVQIAQANRDYVVSTIKGEQRDYIIDEVNSSLIHMSETNGKKYNRENLIAIINLFGREVWRSQVAIAALLSASACNHAQHQEMIATMVTDQFLSIIR